MISLVLEIFFWAKVTFDVAAVIFRIPRKKKPANASHLIAGYVYPAAFARLSPKVRDLVVAKVAKPLRISTEFSRELAWGFHPLPTLPSARLIARSDGLLEGSLKTGSTGNTPQRKEHLITGLLRTRRHAHHISALTCCALRFVEPTPPESHRQDHHIGIWCWLTESNRRHPAYKAGALPTELNQQIAHFTDRLFKPLGFQFNAYPAPPEQSSLL